MMLCSVRLAAAFLLASASIPALGQEGHDMGAMGGMDHSGHDMSATAETSSSAAADDQPGEALAPPVPTDHPGDLYNDPARMAAAREEHMATGSMIVSALLVDEFEYRAVDGKDGYGWKAQGWYGDDYDKVAVTSEGAGVFGEAAERIESSLLWRHAVNPWFNLETGVRHDWRPDPQRTYGVIGLQGLAPYWFEVEAQLLVSNKGDVHPRIGASYDQRITQALILEPEAELNLALQDVPELGIGAGLERAEFGARLRYEVKPGFGPYIGVHWEGSFGGTADRARLVGEKRSQVAAVAGLRAWF
ncbi:copper resistance protein B [Novosphingobium album (ex Hu et al. 2023)]|uniref:Copper resistance protein B n=1 Tax=Novosphingobium album (ex Hu et al. 2023) TaxID=2930093 RepID=A0ABT0B7E0_9SPHN|nr:copper resistance protein B [Novosphingobium album (ex Hu et al. 2023)]MCJ2180997.1 copper resistance protein B [Novosphingobium album (ex Hu et al. 2023)]